MRTSSNILYEIKVINWEKYSPKRGAVYSPWFRFPNDFFNDHKFQALTKLERLVWVYILCCVSKEARKGDQFGSCMLHPQLPARMMMCEDTEIIAAIKKLSHSALGLISYFVDQKGAQ